MFINTNNIQFFLVEACSYKLFERSFTVYLFIYILMTVEKQNN